jgi:hypothetical protein
VSVRFDAATDRVSYTASNPPSPATAITVAGWMYISVDRNDWSTLIRLHAATGGTTNVVLGTQVDGTTPSIFSASGTVLGSSCTVAAWYRIALTLTGSAAKLYQATAAGATVLTSGTVTPGTAPTGLTLGGRSLTDATEWFNGRLAYWRVWSAVLTQTEIEAEWASATPVRTSGLFADWPLTAHTDLTDHSGNGRNLAAGSTATTTEADPPVGALVLGTASAPLGGLSATATGLPKVTATAAAPLGALAAIAAGTPTVRATATAALGGLVATATGVVAVPATATAGLGALTAAASGHTTAAGTAAAPLGALTATATGVPAVAATAVAALGALTAAATGTTRVTGAATAPLGALIASAVGTVTPVGGGAATAAFGALTAAATGLVADMGTATALFGALVATVLAGTPHVDTPPNRTLVVPAENRTLIVAAENRTLVVPGENRTRKAGPG